MFHLRRDTIIYMTKDNTIQYGQIITRLTARIARRDFTAAMLSPAARSVSFK